MTKEKALKLALKALENGMKFVWADPEREAGFVAIDAIKEALAQPTSGDYALGYAEGFNDACKRQPERDPWREATAQPEERNFCPRCGKRTADPTTIHTCTPPHDKTR